MWTDTGHTHVWMQLRKYWNKSIEQKLDGLLVTKDDNDKDKVAVYTDYGSTVKRVYRLHVPVTQDVKT